jgi:DNA mismatch endonuclease, patch repair protein
MQQQGREQTACELAVRSAVHARGLRYRLHQRPEKELRRQADLVFRRARVAVFVDGCFWHGCPAHGAIPRTNSKWWENKIRRTQQRDRETDDILGQVGWLVIRIWEHEEPVDAAMRIENAVRSRIC